MARTYRLDLPLSATLDSIAPFLSYTDASGLGTTKQLIFNTAPLDHHQSLSASGVLDGTTLFLVSSCEAVSFTPVEFVYEGQVYEKACGHHDSVEDLKRIFEKRLNISPKSMEYVYRGETLRDDQQLCDFFSGEDRKIYIAYQDIENKVRSRTEGDFEVSVKTLTGKTIPIYVNSTMRVETVKEIISLYTTFRVEEIRLIFAGKCMCEGMVVGEMGITSGSMIHLILRLR